MAMARPDLSEQPSQCVIERTMKSLPDAAWKKQCDRWFAAPGTVLMRAEVDAPLFFETHYDGGRHSYYGRFLDLDRAAGVRIAPPSDPMPVSKPGIDEAP